MMQPRRIAELLVHLGEAPKSPKQDKCRSASGSAPRRIDELRQAMGPTSTLKVHSANAHLRTPTNLTERGAASLKSKRQLQFSPASKLQHTREHIEAYLRKKDSFKSILDRGWHRMTANEFLSMVNHFLPYAGMDQIEWQPANYVEQLMKTMRELNYPHSVHKSWLSMPNSAMNLSKAMQLLDFLIDFAPTDNVGMTPKAFDWAAKHYRMWLKDSKQQICDEMVHELSGLRDVKALDDDLSKIRTQQMLHERLRQQLEQNKAASELTLQQLQTEEAELKTELANCKDKLKALSLDSRRYEQKLGQLCTQLWRQGLLKEALEQKVNQQSCSQEKLVANFNARHDELTLRHRELRGLVERVNNQVLLLELKREQLNNSIEAYNMYMRDLRYISDCSTALELPAQPTLEEVQRRGLMLQQLCNDFMSKSQLLQLQDAISGVSLRVLRLNIVQQTQESNNNMLQQDMPMQAEISKLNQKLAELQLKQDELARKLL